MSFSVLARVLKTKVGSSKIGDASMKAVLIALADNCNDDGKSCFPSQGTIAAKMEMSDDTVQRAMKRLIADDFVRGEKKRKRGHWQSWNYEINLDKLWSDQAAESGTVEDNQAAESGMAEPQKAARPGRKVRHKPINKPINQPSPKRPSSADALGPLGSRLAARIGRKLFDAWFSHAELGGVTGDLLTIEMPNAFSASRVMQDYEQDVMACCRSEYPDVRGVRFVARTAA